MRSAISLPGRLLPVLVLVILAGSALLAQGLGPEVITKACEKGSIVVNNEGFAPAVNGCDGDTSTGWRTVGGGVSTGSWRIDLGAGNKVSVNAYNITFPVDTDMNALDNISLWGSNNDSAYTLINWTDPCGTCSGNTYLINLTTSAPFRYYMFNLTSIPGDRRKGFQEIQLYSNVSASDFGSDDWLIAAHPPDNDSTLYIYLPFERGFTDGSIYQQNNATPYANPVLDSSGAIGQSMDIMGTGDHLRLNADFSTDNFTITAWMYWGGVNNTIIISQDSTTDGSPAINLNVTNSKLQGGISGSTASLGVEGQNAPPEEWQHVAMVFNGTHFFIYQNGTLTGTSGAVGIPMIDTTEPIGIGAHVYGGGSAINGNWQGKLDEVRIYNRTLTAAEILSHYQQARNNHTVVMGYSPSASLNFSDAIVSFDISWYKNGTLNRSLGDINDPDLVAWWPLDYDVRDYAGSHDGLRTNATLNKTAAKVGAGSYNFDGDKDNINMPYSNDFNFGSAEDFAITYWFKTNSSSTANAMLGKLNTTANDGYWIVSSAGMIRFNITNASGSSRVDTLGASYNDGAWHHLVAMRRMEGTNLSIYIDGRIENSRSVTARGVDSLPSKSNFTLGQPGRFAQAPYYYNGSLDDVRVYSRNLSDSEIYQMYTAGLWAGMTIPFPDTSEEDNWTMQLTPVDATAIGTAYNKSILISNVPPTYSGFINNATTATKQDGYVNWSITFSDGSALDTYVFSYNGTGEFTSDSPMQLIGTSAFVNVTKQIAVAAGNYVCANFTVNDIFSNEAHTAFSCFTVEAEIDYSEFKGIGATTDLYDVGSSDVNVTLILQSAYGKIAWNANVTLNTSINLSNAVELNATAAYVNSSVAVLNTSANITIYTSLIRHPALYKDGAACTDCTLLDISPGYNFTFNVSSFSAYTWEEANQSRIDNYGPTNSTVKLNMKVQYYNISDDSWLNVTTVVNTTIDLNASDVVKLDSYFNGLWNIGMASYGSGTYRVYASLTSFNETVIENLDGTLLESSYNFSVVTNLAPVVTRQLPANDTHLPYKWSTLNYTATDHEGSSLSCYVFGDAVDGSTLLATQPLESGNSTLYNWTDLSDGTYYWNVLCGDGEFNSTLTANYTFTIDTTFPQISFTPPTEQNNTAVRRSWIMANITVTEENEANITFELHNAAGLASSAVYNQSNRTHNFTLLAQRAFYYYNVTVVDRAGNSNTSETRTIKLTIAPSAKKFEIRADGNAPVASFDDKGDIYLQGAVAHSQSQLAPTPNSFIIENRTGSAVAFINSSGYLFLQGSYEELASALAFSDSALEIRNATDALQSFIDSFGNLKLRGLIEGDSADP